MSGLALWIYLMLGLGVWVVADEQNPAYARQPFNAVKIVAAWPAIIPPFIVKRCGVMP